MIQYLLRFSMLLYTHKIKYNISNPNKLYLKITFQTHRHPALTLVGVVRLLRLSQTQPELAERVSLLMDHVQEIKVLCIIPYTSMWSDWLNSALLPLTAYRQPLSHLPFKSARITILYTNFLIFITFITHLTKSSIETGNGLD